MSDQALSNLLHEDRRFPPPPEVTEYANGKVDLFDQAGTDVEAFWAQQARS